MVIEARRKSLKRSKPPGWARFRPRVIRHRFLCGPDFFNAWEELGQHFAEAMAERYPFGGYPDTRDVKVLPENLPLVLAERVRQIMTRCRDDQEVKEQVIGLVEGIQVSASSGDLTQPKPCGRFEFILPPPSFSPQGRPRKPATFHRDLEILRLREECELSYGQIAIKLRLGRKNVVESAYKRTIHYRAQLHKAYTILQKHLKHPHRIGVELREDPHVKGSRNSL